MCPEKMNTKGLIPIKWQTSVLLYLFTLRITTALEVGILTLANQHAYHVIEKSTWEEKKLTWEKHLVNTENE